MESVALVVSVALNQLEMQPLHHVHLVQASIIPGGNGKFVDAVVDGGIDEVAEASAILVELGLCGGKSLLAAGPGGKLLISLDTASGGDIQVEGEVVEGIVF